MFVLLCFSFNKVHCTVPSLISDDARCSACLQCGCCSVVGLVSSSWDNGPPPVPTSSTRPLVSFSHGYRYLGFPVSLLTDDIPVFLYPYSRTITHGSLHYLTDLCTYVTRMPVDARTSTCSFCMMMCLVCMYVCVYVCVCVCLYVCVCVCVCMCVHVCMYRHVQAHIHWTTPWPRCAPTSPNCGFSSSIRMRNSKRA